MLGSCFSEYSGDNCDIPINKLQQQAALTAGPIAAISVSPPIFLFGLFCVFFWIKKRKAEAALIR